MICLIVHFQDGAYSYADFRQIFTEYDVQRVIRAYENSITISVHCCEEGEWNQERINKEQFSEFCQVAISVTPKYTSLAFTVLIFFSG